MELLSLGPCRLPPGGPQGHQPQAVRPGAAVGAGIILCDPDVSDMLNLLRCTISTTSQSVLMCPFAAILTTKGR